MRVEYADNIYHVLLEGRGDSQIMRSDCDLNVLGSWEALRAPVTSLSSQKSREELLLFMSENIEGRVVAERTAAGELNPGTSTFVVKLPPRSLWDLVAGKSVSGEYSERGTKKIVLVENYD